MVWPKADWRLWVMRGPKRTFVSIRLMLPRPRPAGLTRASRDIISPAALHRHKETGRFRPLLGLAVALFGECGRR